MKEDRVVQSATLYVIEINMEGNTKKEKIAAARKKLKKFKQTAGNNSSKFSSTKNNETKKQKDSDKHIQTTEQEKNDVQQSGSMSMEMEESKNHVPSDQMSDDDAEMRTTASAESLHHISRQINGLIAEPPYVNDSGGGESNTDYMQSRNEELASRLQKYTEENQKLKVQMEQTREHAQSLQSQLDQEQENFKERHKKEIGPLRDQLQVHIQTIGILVAEKTELQSQLNQSQKIAGQRLSEIEEMNGRLKVSRQRVGDLERSLATSNNSCQQFEKSSKEFAKEVDRLKLEVHQSKKIQDELHQQILEVGEQIQSKKSEAFQAEEKVRDLTARLEMAELRAQQLSNQSEDKEQTFQTIEQLYKERDALQAALQETQESYTRINSEKEELKQHFQSCIEQLQSHNSNLTSQVTALTKERENMVSREHELESAVLELQEKLQNLDTEQTHANESCVASQEKLDQLMAEKQDIKQQLESQVRDNGHLSRLLGEKEEKIADLENNLLQIKKEADDMNMLLEGVQNDKTALSRALTQNKDLKQQLVELQNGFVKMSNDNMELMTKVQSEQHTSRELLCRLSQQDEEIKHLKDTISCKDKEVMETQQQNSEKTYQDDHIQDRLRHYEAQAQLTETLQRELQNSQDMIDALTTQNSELRTMLIKSAEKAGDNGSQNSEENGFSEDVINSLRDAVKQLEKEKEQLTQNLKDQRELSDRLSVNLADMQEELVNQSNGTAINPAEYFQLKNALEMIQDKYNKVMRDKADLSDKAEQLEHIVLQLQGESDTIGEYISLYHHQRALLQQRESQKNEYISHLARDREEIQGKLSELQILVMQLLGEKNMLHNYHEESATETNLLKQHHQHGHHHHGNQIHDMNATQPHGMVNGSTDWPDYTSSESDDESEVEAIVNVTKSDSVSEPNVTETKPQPPEKEENVVPPKDDHHTANKILHLLSEIGHSNLIDHSVEDHIDHNFLPCKYCKGQVYVI